MNKETAVGRSAAAHASVEQQFVAAAERAELRHKPFDHVYMDQIFDPETYATLLAAMPDRRSSPRRCALQRSWPLVPTKHRAAARDRFSGG